MLSAEEETIHANDAGFDAGRSGPVGNPSQCSAASRGAAGLARRHEWVCGPSTHEALILLYVGPKEHRQSGSVRATVGPQELRPTCGVRETGTSDGYGRLSLAPLLYRSVFPKPSPTNPEISGGGPAATEKSAAAEFPVPQA